MTGLKRPRGWIVRRKDVPRGLTAQDVYTPAEVYAITGWARTAIRKRARKLGLRRIWENSRNGLYLRTDIWRMMASAGKRRNEEYMAMMLTVWEAVREERGLDASETALLLRLLDPAASRPPVHLDQVLSTSETVRYIGLPQSSLAYYCQRYEIPWLAIGNRNYYPIEGLNRLARILEMEQPYEMNEENYDLIPARPSGE